LSLVDPKNHVETVHLHILEKEQEGAGIDKLSTQNEVEEAVMNNDVSLKMVRANETDDDVMHA
jgi:hypothetical protein